MRSILAACLIVFATACGSPSRARCSECGMFADVAPEFRVTALDGAGHAVAFDAPRCMFRYRIAHGAGSLREVRVVEHYSQRPVPMDGVPFVIGSDVIGPMGRDLVPVAQEHTERFVRDHGGRVVAASSVDSAVLASLDR